MSELSNLQGPPLPGQPEGFDVFYATSTPPWEIERPQRAVQQLADAGHLRGRVLDVGCGTGEHTLLAASFGCNATGVDAAPTAIERVRAKAEARHLEARFVVGDVLAMSGLVEGPFDTIVDSAVFHVFSDADRPRFVAALEDVLAPGGRYFMLVFNEHAPGSGGPRRITQDEIRSTFASGWRVDAIEESRIETIGMDVPAWLASLTRT